MYPYTFIRSDRRTLSIQIARGWHIIARAPLNLWKHAIDAFLEKKSLWIEKHLEKEKKRHNPQIEDLSDTEKKRMKQVLKTYIDQRVSILWQETDLPRYASIKITLSEHRWWSCSSKNGLCFSYRLAHFLSGEQKNLRFIDAVIIHELAHLREKHHRSSFWELIYDDAWLWINI